MDDKNNITKDNNIDYSREKVLEVIKEIRETSVKNGLSDMTLEEINEEIDKARRGE